MMTVLFEEKLDEYYRTGKFKGFYEVIEHEQGRMTHLTLTNGFQEISVSGMFKSDALQCIFHQIDSVRSN
ncbi:hypothetical protein [Fodinibius sp. AD559]|uniref:hypothetical protein n=1 Tax=Fodinibius sp. AD559 TaxID=3424179 RepID=UPI004046B054